MPIPDFDHNNVLPPHLGDPRRRAQLSPYPTTSEDVCRKFGTSDARREILQGWLRFRTQLTALGITSGFQWLDGSFLENIELTENRSPNDLDVVTYYYPPPNISLNNFLNNQILPVLPEFVDRDLAKQNYKLDHFPITLSVAGHKLVDHTRYWTGLFSHRRDGVWKGMLRVELNTAASDTAAVTVLQPAQQQPAVVAAPAATPPQPTQQTP